MTIQTTYSEAFHSLGRLIDEVTNHREVVIIEKFGVEPVAIISAAELKQLMSNANPLRSPRPVQRHLSRIGRSLSNETAVPPADDLRRSLLP